jgi:NAD(P)-dependent dehydrogenase (short-subunit alcohol dehydrogenase family)
MVAEKGLTVPSEGGPLQKSKVKTRTLKNRRVRHPQAALAVISPPPARLGRVTDIAPLAVFLASEESGWITGEVIRAAGGLVVAT